MSLYLLRILFKLTSIVGFALMVAAPLHASESTRDSQVVYQEAIANGQYEEAELAAKRLLQQAIRDGQRDELSTAALLNDLAYAQYHNENYDAALQNYELSISIVESNTDMLNRALVEPLLGIGTLQVRRNRPDLALLPVERALHVHAVNDGPHNLSQSAALELLADAYLAMGEYTDAADTADRLVILYNRNFASDSPEIVPALMRKGSILRAALQWRDERDAYSDAVSILRKNGKASSALLARPFIALGDSHQAEYFHDYHAANSEEDLPDTKLLEKAENYYREALEQAQKAKVPNWRVMSEAQLALADFFVLTEQPVRARRYYRDAWQLLSASPERAEARRDQLETIKPLWQVAPDLTVALPEDDSGSVAVSEFDAGNIVVTFTVNRRGRLTNIGLLEMEPERNAAIEAEVKKALTQFIYRPRFANGVAVATPDQQIRYTFPVLKSETK
jgi:hypothetical protein